MQAKEPSNVVRFADRLPPQAVELEEQILGELIFDPNAIDRVSPILSPEAFYVSQHGQIYATLLEMRRAEQAIDLNTVCVRLKNCGLLEKVGGQNHILALVGRVIAAIHVEAYATIVVEKYKRRKLMTAARQILELAQDETQDWTAIEQDSQQKIFDLSDSSQQAGLKPLRELLETQLDFVDSIGAGEKSPAIATGFYDLDAMMGGGLRGGGLYVVAGRPAMGKSCYAAAIGRHIAKSAPVVLFSLEMSGGQVAQRLWAAEAEVDAGKLATGQINADEYQRLGNALLSLSNLPLSVDESQSIDINHIRTQSRRFKAENGGLGLIIVDYLHLMLDEEDTASIGKLTREFKRMARQLDVPVLLLSQLSRAVENRNDKRPNLSDLRSSGNIEQDADAVIMLYRDEYYDPETIDRGIAEVIVAKHRSGPVGTVKLLFEPHLTRFRNLAIGSFG